MNFTLLYIYIDRCPIYDHLIGYSPIQIRSERILLYDINI
jgi:hypothetical protein